MGDHENGKNRVIILTISSLLLVAMVIGLTIGISNTDDDDEFNKSHGRHNKDVLTTAKAIQSICQPTDYKDACIQSLANANSTDPKELIRVAFDSTKNVILEASRNSSMLKQLYSDPRTREALKDCKEMAQTAANDLERSVNQITSIEHVAHFDDALDNLKIWLSGALTYQQTCLDGFENLTDVDAGEKMKQYLKLGMQLTINGLAMVDEISQALSMLNLDNNQNLNAHRRLLSHDQLSVLEIDDLKPNLVVAKDGTGDFTNITAALASIPRNKDEKFVLYVKEGVYEEKLQVDRNLTHLVMVGDGPTKTKITGRLNWVDGVPTFHTASMVVLGDHFIGKDIGVENYAGPEKHQAVALRVGADMSIFYNCQIDGYQDTLYSHAYRQFYRNCVISGTIDFIFGDSAAVFQNCTMLVRKPMENQANIVTAHGRKEPRQPTGLVLQNCNVVADPAYYPVRFKIKSYLARPWKEYSRMIIMESYIDDLIAEQGFLPWGGTFGIDTCYYVEFNNRGPGSVKLNRIIWPGIKEVTKNIIKEHFIASKFLDGNSWIPKTGVPYNQGLIYPTPNDRPNAIHDDEMLNNERDNSQKHNFENNSNIIAPVNLTAISIPPAPTPVPSIAPTPSPNSWAPTPVPSTAPTPSPNSWAPTQVPSTAPTPSPNSWAPTPVPSTAPMSPNSWAPTPVPSIAPTPSLNSLAPTPVPSTAPMSLNSWAPTPVPSTAPTPSPNSHGSTPSPSTVHTLSLNSHGPTLSPSTAPTPVPSIASIPCPNSHGKGHHRHHHHHHHRHHLKSFVSAIFGSQ